MNIKFTIFLVAICTFSAKLLGQQVPSRMEFANMDLRLTEGAIKDIQADVDALTRSEKYFLKKLERVDMYMPIIERIFKEEGLPEDFKYLVIQESALISDAVSSSNAVGFWQFKEISGLENDLRIDRTVDERMNIVSSSRAAANYLKDHNKYFDNWAYSLIAYQRGRGGAADVIDESNFGKTKLKITQNTYWYLKKFLAHKVAFENAIGTSTPPYYLKEVDNMHGESLKTIAKEENIPFELIEEYNKWIKKGKIPEDKNYTVIVPLSNLQTIDKLQNQKKMTSKDLPGSINDQQQQNFPLVDNYPSRADRSIPHQVEINGLDGIYAPAGYTVKKLAETGGVDEYKFRKWNDLKIREELKTGKVYYLRRKRNRAKFYYHTVAEKETMWEVSQKYGLKLKKLYRKNRMQPTQEPKVGRVLWLRHNRPANIPIEFREVPEDEVQLKETIEVINPQLKKATKAEESVVEKTDVNGSTKTTDSLVNLSTNGRADSITLQKEQSLDTSKIKAENNSLENEIKSEEKDYSTMDSGENQTLKESTKQTTELEQIKGDELATEELMEYSIKKGDTFFSIANKFNMKISKLLNVNELGIRDTLSIGQIIQVNKGGFITENQQEPSVQNPPKEKLAEQTNTDIEHKVASGETMYSLAKKYEVSLKEIMEWNNKQDYNLKEGELILIKQK